MRIETRIHGLRLSKAALERLERHIRVALAPWSLRASSAHLYLNRANDLSGDERIGRLVVRLPKVGDVVVTDRHARVLPLVKHLGRLASAVINRRIERRRRLRRRLSRNQEVLAMA